MITIKRDLEACTRCGICHTTTRPFLQGKGSESPTIVVVGEAPTAEEESRGEVFLGPAVVKLADQLKIAGIDSSQVYFTDSCKCRLPHSVKGPTKEIVDCCREHLIQEIQLLKPKLIIACGNAALYSVLPESVSSPEGIMRFHGRTVHSEAFNCEVIPVLHPSAILRRAELDSVARADWERVGRHLRGETSTVDTKFDVLETLDQAREFFECTLPNVHAYAFDTETQNLDYLTAALVSVQWSWQKGHAVVLPMYVHGHRQWGDDEHLIRQYLRSEFCDRPCRRIAQNMKFDAKHLRTQLGGEVIGQYFDTMLAAHLLDENQAKDLTSLSQTYTDMDLYEYHMDDFWKSQKVTDEKRDYRTVPWDILVPYSARDADCTWRLYEVLNEQLSKDHGLYSLFHSLVMPIQEVLGDMEFRGTNVDTSLAGEMSRSIEKNINECQVELAKIAGSELNVNSSKQLAGLLYTTIGLPILKTTATGAPSCDAETLETLKSHHPVVPLVLEMRSLTKLKSTFIDGLEKLLGADGRLHTTFNVAGTSTGRLSSSGPNLQNIPQPKEGKDYPIIRRLFVPSRPGWGWLKSDYSQAEFRYWGYMSQDEDIQRETLEGVDIHRRAAAHTLGISEDEVTTKQRNDAKLIIFGLMYGRGARSVSEQLGITEEEARVVVDWFSHRYPRAWNWLSETQSNAKKTGVSVSSLGRVRHIPGVSSSDENEVAQAMRHAVNSPIQSAASDTTLAALVRIYRRIKRDRLPAELLLVVHDEIDLEFELAARDEIVAMVCEEMLHPIPSIIFPSQIEITILESWGGPKLEEFKYGDTPETYKLLTGR